MKKVFALLAGVGLLIPLFVGCGKGEKYDPQSGMTLLREIESALNADPQTKVIQLPELALRQKELLKDRAGALSTMGAAEKACKEIEDVQERISAYSQVAKGYSSLGNQGKARGALKEATETLKHLPEGLRAEDRMNVFIRVAEAQGALNAEADASETLTRALGEAEQVSDEVIRSSLYFRVADAFASFGQESGCDIVAEKIDALAESAETPRQRAEMFADMANAYAAAKALEKMQTYAERSKEAIETIDSAAVQAVVLCRLALALNAGGNQAEAQDLVKDAQRRYSKDSDSTRRQIADETIINTKPQVGL
ncbi:MAG: hypothetical protein Q4D38_02835 [Planctomycetia bacterium]|nr:hypothetical protein [Planctomycetia bacterium]